MSTSAPPLPPQPAARLPSVDRVLSTPLARALSAEHGASIEAIFKEMHR